MSAIIQKSFRGMQADVSPHDASEGTVALAKNVVFRRAGLVEPRNGLYGKQASELSAIVNVQDIRPYDGGVAVLDDAKLCLVPGSGGSAVAVDEVDSGGEITMPDGYVSSVEFRDNLYLATDKGVTKVTSISDTKAEYAGVGANGSYISFFVVTDSVNWLQTGYVAGYRTVIRRTDANGVVTRSRPSAALHCANDSGNDRSTTVTVKLDVSAAEANDVIEVYRTISVPGTVAPDTYFFAFELETADGSTNVDVLDDVAEDELGAVLYATNAPASGKPYSGKCVAQFAGSLFVGNCTGPYSRRLALVGGASPAEARITETCTFSSGSPTLTATGTVNNPLGSTIVIGMFVIGTGIPVSTRVTNVVGSTITIDKNTTGSGPQDLFFYEAISIHNGSTTHDSGVFFLRVESGGLLQGLEVISIKGTSQTGPSQAVVWDGAFILRELQPGANGYGPFSIRSTNPDVLWQNPLPDWDEARVEFDRDVEPALLMWSLRDKPEMFTPGVGQVYVGDQGKAIWRLVARSDHMLIFKEDGTFVLEGASERSGFRLDRLSDHVIMTPRHACEVDDGVAVWTSDGVVIFSDYGGMRDISTHMVDRYLKRFPAPSDDPSVISGNMFFDSAYNELHLIAENLADVTDHPELDAPIHLVWNSKTNAWSLWDVPGTAAIGCSPGYDNARHSILSIPSGIARIWNAVVESEQTITERAFGDVYEEAEGLTVTIVDNGPGDVYQLYYFDDTFTAEPLPVVGDAVVDQGANRIGIVSDVEDLGGSSYRVHFTDSRFSWTTGSRTIDVIKAYTAKVQLHPKSAKPGTWAHWKHALWEFTARMSLRYITVGTDSIKGLISDSYLSDQDSAQVTLSARVRDSFSSSASPYYIPSATRYLFPRTHANAMMVQPFIEITEGGARWALSACHIEYRPGTATVERRG